MNWGELIDKMLELSSDVNDLVNCVDTLHRSEDELSRQGREIVENVKNVEMILRDRLDKKLSEIKELFNKMEDYDE